MPIFPTKHRLLLIDTLNGLFYQNHAKREFIDSQNATRVLHEELVYAEAQITADADIGLNGLSNDYQKELEIQKLGNVLAVADDAGKKSQAYSQRQAGFDLDQIIQTAIAGRGTRIKLETEKASSALSLATLRNQFKTDYASIDGEYRIILAGLDAANTKNVSDVRISGMGAKSAIDVIGIGREAQVEADSILSYSAASINLGDLSTLSEKTSLLQNSAADIAYIGQDASQQSAFIDINNQSEINSDAASSEQRIAAIQQRSVIEVAEINNGALLDSEFQKLETLNTIDNEASQTAIAIGSAQAANALEIGYEAQVSNSRVTGIALENAAKIINISATTGIETLGDLTISSIENTATLESAQLDVNSDSLINALDIQDSNSQTSDRINALNSQTQSRAANEYTIAYAETGIDLLAAQQTAFYAQQETAVRVGDIRAEAETTIANIQRSSDLTSTAVIADTLSMYNSVVKNAKIAADYQTQATEYINGISSSAANQKSRYMYIEGLAHKSTVTYSYTVNQTGSTPDLPSIDGGGFTIFNSPSITPETPGFL